jgi:bacteriocin-like protein
MIMNDLDHRELTDAELDAVSGGLTPMDTIVN